MKLNQVAYPKHLSASLLTLLLTALPLAAAPVHAAADPPAIDTLATTHAAVATIDTYIVVRGDCLWKISAHHGAPGPHWRTLYTYNRSFIHNPNLILPGSRLLLPPPSLLSQPSVLPALTPVDNAGSSDLVSSLSVTLFTNGDLFSGSDCNAVLDIGPRSYWLPGPFPRGQAVTTVPMDFSPSDSLHVSDIATIRISKKGYAVKLGHDRIGFPNGGFTGAPDGIAGALLPNVCSPAELIGRLRGDVQTAAQVLAEAKVLEDAALTAAKAGRAEVSKALVALADVEDKIRSKTSSLDAVRRRLQDIPKLIANGGEKITREIDESVPEYAWALFCGWCVIGHHIVAHYVEEVIHTVGDLTSEAAQLQLQLASIPIELTALALEKTAAIERLAANALNSKTLDDALALASEKEQINLRLADVANTGLEEAEAFVRRLPTERLFLRIPKPGDWQITGVTLTVNGATFYHENLDVKLDARNHAWEHPIEGNAERRFAECLHTSLPDAGGAERKLVVDGEPVVGLPSVTGLESGITTPLGKDQGISGWDEGPVRSATVTGTLVRPPSPGLDACVSLDLEVESVSTNGRHFLLDGNHGILHKRFLRAEYFHSKDLFGDDDRYHSWSAGQHFEVTGRIRRDTDRTEFLEVHPSRPKDIVVK